MKSRMLWSVVVAAGLGGLPALAAAQKEDMQQAVQQRMTAGLEKRNMEKAALDNDPKVIAAKDKMDQAEKDWTALQAQVDEAIKTDPDYLKAKDESVKADEKLAQAKKALGDANKAQRQAELAAIKQRSASSASSSGYGNSGGTQTYVKPAPKVNPLAGQQKAVKEATDEDNKAKLAMAQARSKVERSLESKDDWKAAKLARDKAKGEYDAAVKPVLEALKTKPQYKAILKQELDAQAVIDQANAGR